MSSIGGTTAEACCPSALPWRTSVNGSRTKPALRVLLLAAIAALAWVGPVPSLALAADDRGASAVAREVKTGAPNGEATEARSSTKSASIRATTRKRRPALGGGTRVPIIPGPDRRTSEAGVCRSQCNLQRSSCDSRGPGTFRDRSDQIRASQSSCYLAVQSCLARCR
jgi:hypothetical protein